MSNSKFLKSINVFEDGLLVVILGSMIVLAIYQIFARNLFGEGVVWIDPLLRSLVLWVGLAGAVVATRTDHHIKIDIFAKYFPPHILKIIRRVVYLFTCSICLLIAWHAARFVHSEYEYNTMAFSGVPAWLVGLIIPLSFTLIAIRYVLLFITPYNREVIQAVDQ